MSKEGRQIYEDLDLKPVINASGFQTVLGGSRVSEEVQAVMDMSNRYFIDMELLLKRTGEMIAEMVGAEAAFVTPGCAAALALSTAACMSGSDGEKIERLPDTTGMKDVFLIQKRQRYHYDRCLSIFGGKLVEVGDEEGTTTAQLETAIDDQTAAVHYYAPGGDPGVLSPEEVIQVAHANGVPVMVDAASQIFPLDRIRYWHDIGMDLVGYGAKYFGSCHSSGILCGRKDLIEAAFLHSFIGYETSPWDSIGRPLKVDRGEVLAVVTALKAWLEMDHDARLEKYVRKAQVLLTALKEIPHVKVEWHEESRALTNGVRVTIDEEGLGKTAEEVIEELKAGDPCIWTRGQKDWVNVAVTNLIEDEETIVAERLREVLTV
ncbi:MAG: aminotransferase class V-fold PLP-dependent enzyme [bacterium]|nr:aminotransferase class V-fold PLP-dependent enzyme [bacterium]